MPYLNIRAFREVHRITTGLLLSRRSTTQYSEGLSEVGSPNLFLGPRPSSQLTLRVLPTLHVCRPCQSSNVYQPGWYLIASAAGMVHSVGSSSMYWRHSIPYSHPSPPLSSRIPQCHLASLSCHVLPLAPTHKTGSLTRTPNSASGLNLTISMSI
jgi:hypothetical protein